MLFACKCLNVSLLAPAAESATASGGRALTDALMLQLQQQPQALQSKPTSEQMQFLQKAVGPFESVRVTVRQADLVRTSQLGAAAAAAAAVGDVSSPWRLDQCIGCDMWTHATNRSGQLVLINPETMTNDEDIKYLETTANYSKTFGLLLNQSSHDQQYTSSDMAAARQKAPETFRSEQLRHKRLQQHFRDAVQREIEATDERIRTYTEQQFAQLRAFREHTAAEYQTLVRLALSVPESEAVPLSPPTGASGTTTALASAKVLLDTTPPATPDSTPMSIGNSPNFGRPPPSAAASTSGAAASSNGMSLLASSLSAQRAIPFKSKTSPLRTTTTSSTHYHTSGGSGGNAPPTQLAQSYGGGGVIEQAVDAFFFEMDGAAASGSAASNQYPMLGHSNSYMSDVEESDSDDSTDNPSDGLAIPRSQIRPKSLSIAQSMPISMPACNELQRSSEADDDDYDEYAGNLDDGVDIAASIKALARSVHGDAVFGDLPRPRFSTQI